MSLFVSVKELYKDRFDLPDHCKLPPDLPTLEHLTELHLKHIPFENLSFHTDDTENNVLIDLDRSALVKKLLQDRRGGCCLELNGLFSFLLCELGYPVVRLIPCFVSAGPERGHKTSRKFRTVPSHFVLMVGIQSQQNKNLSRMDYYIVDVGLGEPPLGPLHYSTSMIDCPQTTSDGMVSRFVWDRPWVDGSGRQRHCVILQWRSSNTGRESHQEEHTWVPRLQWDIADAPLDGSSAPKSVHDLASFSYVIDILREPKNTFARKLIVCTLTRDAKTSLVGRRLRITSPRFGPSRECHDVELTTEEDILEALNSQFGIQLPPNIKLDLRRTDAESKSRIWDHL